MYLINRPSVANPCLFSIPQSEINSEANFSNEQPECLKLRSIIHQNTDSESKMEDVEEDFCVCRRCRSLSGSFISANGISYPQRSRNYSNYVPKERKLTNDLNEAIVEQGEERRFSLSLPIDNEIGEPDDEPLLVPNEGFEGEDDAEVKEHCHVRRVVGSGVKRAKKKLIVSSILCLTFMIAEVVGYYLSNSVAIMTDATHLLSDLTSFLISLFAIWVGQKSPTKRMSFGFYRAEILGAVISVLIIWVLTGILVYMAIGRVINPDYEIDADVMLIVSALGVAMNIVMGIVLHGICGGEGHGHSHGLGGGRGESHGHSHGGGDNINVRAAFIHVMGDLIQSLGVMVAAYIIRYKPEYKLADPICTFIFSLLVLFTTFTIMRDALHVLMEGFPRNMDYANIKADLQSLEGVMMAHSLHIWSLTIDKNALAVHLAIAPDCDPHKILQEAQALIQKKYHLYQSTIQVEKYNADVMLGCQTCLGPNL